MDAPAIERLVEYLGWVRARPAMYLGAVEVEAAVRWLDGFAGALWALTRTDRLHLAREQVLTARGWSFTAAHPATEMVARGLTPAEVVDELLAIEAEVVRLLANLDPDEPMRPGMVG